MTINRQKLVGTNALAAWWPAHWIIENIDKVDAGIGGQKGFCLCFGSDAVCVLGWLFGQNRTSDFQE